MMGDRSSKVRDDRGRCYALVQQQVQRVHGHKESQEEAREVEDMFNWVH